MCNIWIGSIATRGTVPVASRRDNVMFVTSADVVSILYQIIVIVFLRAKHSGTGPRTTDKDVCDASRSSSLEHDNTAMALAFTEELRARAALEFTVRAKEPNLRLHSTRTAAA